MNSSLHEVLAGAPALVDRDAVADAIMDVVPRAMRRLRQATRANTGAALTVPQVRALLFVRRDPGTDLSALAEHLGMSAPSASMLVERLVKAGLVERHANPGERRRVALALTTAGAADVERARAATRGCLADALAILPTDEMLALATSLPLLDHVTAAMDPGSPRDKAAGSDAGVAVGTHRGVAEPPA